MVLGIEFDASAVRSRLRRGLLESDSIFHLMATWLKLSGMDGALRCRRQGFSCNCDPTLLNWRALFARHLTVSQTKLVSWVGMNSASADSFWGRQLCPYLLLSSSQKLRRTFGLEFRLGIQWIWGDTCRQCSRAFYAFWFRPRCLVEWGYPASCERFVLRLVSDAASANLKLYHACAIPSKTENMIILHKLCDMQLKQLSLTSTAITL